MKHKQNRYNMHLRLYMAAQTPQDHRHSSQLHTARQRQRTACAHPLRSPNTKHSPICVAPRRSRRPTIARAARRCSDLYTFMFIFDLNK